MRFRIATTNPEDPGLVRISMKALAYHMVVGHVAPEYFDQSIGALENVPDPRPGAKASPMTGKAEAKIGAKSQRLQRQMPK